MVSGIVKSTKPGLFKPKPSCDEFMNLNVKQSELTFIVTAIFKFTINCISKNWPDKQQEKYLFNGFESHHVFVFILQTFFTTST